ncbi:hypothetical protein EJ04DRAFT_582391 [Polyplosphaeria fusca]|uniref:Heterokaryon incompatibility domain-containing protein n=1 Tax=Polyplosphaeria fusca TaxID=682080 RepID=A0A9P4UVJ1_9PLEO|nr:hypothetical protein EJ04DRAFT_582391 [Polyplosphaeria fusca]
MVPAGPLCAEYRLFQNGNAVTSFSDTIRNWFAALKTLETSEARRQLLSSLHSTQAIALQLLEEWWNYDNREDGNAGKWMIEQHEKAKIFPEFNPRSVQSYTIFPRSTYKRTLLDLWEWEFRTSGMLETNSKQSDAVLFLFRQRAATVAASYRTSRCLWGSLSNGTLTILESQSLSDRLITQAPFPSCLQACPWLDRGEKASRLPYYLWYVKEKRTVRCPTGNPPFLVVSHTWGRWKILSKTAKVSGVPWPVPCNTIFDVQALPNILSRFPFDVDYIWFDLVCIPQDGSLLQQTEIARQAEIFSAARYATVWMNQIPDWTGLRAAITWYIMCTIENCEKELDHPTDASSFIAERAEQNTGLTQVEVSEEGYQVPMMEIDGWFTSLWTLQEACLRPDMLLCGGSFEVLQLEGSSFPLPLGYIIAIVSRSAMSLSSEELPMGPTQLFQVLEISEMLTLLDMSPLDVIIFGNQRYCQDNNRAVAIMSALGFTDWYTQHHQDPQTTVYLEDRYPLEFISEAKQKLGGLFFATESRRPEKYFIYDPARQKIIGISSTGTMLPFKQDLKQKISRNVDVIAKDDHPSIATWTILQDGAVEMPQVGLIGSWPWTATEDIMVGIKAFTQVAIESQYIPSTNLREWFGSFRPASEKHAICLLRSAMITCSGVLVERVYANTDTAHFVKIGYFFFTVGVTPGHEDKRVFHFPPCTEVGWRVL